MQQNSRWEALPDLALVNIFCRTSIKDRSRSIPFVCRSWAHAARDPQCWVSMVPENHSVPAADHAFVMDSHPYALSFVDPYDGRRSLNPDRGVACLQGFIGRSGGGAKVTSIYFFPFLTSAGGSPNDDAILRVIAKHCRNLKHLSFHGSNNASEEAILEVIHSCRKLELLDFSNSPYFNPLNLVKFSSYCPNIRGIRRNGYLEQRFSYVLTSGFPSLRILNLSNSSVVDRDLVRIANGCKELSYLDFRFCDRLSRFMHIVKAAASKIAEITFN